MNGRWNTSQADQTVSLGTVLGGFIADGVQAQELRRKKH